MSLSSLRKHLGFSPSSAHAGGTASGDDNVPSTTNVSPDVSGGVPDPVSSSGAPNARGFDPTSRPRKTPGTPGNPGFVSPTPRNPSHPAAPPDHSEAASQFLMILRELIGLDEDVIEIVTTKIGVTFGTEAFSITRDEWISYNEQIGKCLTPMQISRLSGLQRWYSQYSTYYELSGLNFRDTSEVYNYEDYSTLLAIMNSTQKPPSMITCPAPTPAPPPSPSPETSTDRSALPQGFVKPNLKDYVALPGKKWEISRDSFRATAISHGFLSALEGLSSNTTHSAATLEHQRIACQFMFGAGDLLIGF